MISSTDSVHYRSGHLSFTLLLLGSLIVLAAAFLQGLSGFGFSLLALPLITMLLPIKLVVPMFTIFSLILNVMVLASSWRGLHLGRVWPLMVAGVLGVPLGAYLLNVLNGDILRIAIGVVVIAASATLASGFRVHLSNERHAMIPVGIASGLLSGSITFGGPPVIIFLANQQVDKTTFRANITAYFMMLNIVGIPTYAFTGLITREVLNYSLYFLPALVAGTLAGIVLAHRVREEHFRRMTLLLIGLLGILCIWTGIRDLV